MTKQALLLRPSRSPFDRRLRPSSRFLVYRPLNRPFVKITETDRQRLITLHRELFSLWASVERALKKVLGTDKVAFEPDKTLDAKHKSSTYDPATRAIFRDVQSGKRTWEQLMAEDAEAARLYRESQERTLTKDENDLVQQVLVRVNSQAIRARKNERLSKDSSKRRHATYYAR